MWNCWWSVYVSAALWPEQTVQDFTDVRQGRIQTRGEVIRERRNISAEMNSSLLTDGILYTHQKSNHEILYIR